jgi:hypothetical protein
MGRLQFADNAAGIRAHGMVEREELCGVSVGPKTVEIVVFAPDGEPLDADAALDRRDDPGLIFIATRSVLEEVSLVVSPGDPHAIVRACGEDVLIRQVIKDGEARLRKILDREREREDPDEMLRRILDRRIIHHGPAESIL